MVPLELSPACAWRLSSVILVVVFAVVGCAQPRVWVPPRDVALEWNEFAIDLIRVDRTSPADAARNLALAHAAMFDAVNSIEATHAAFLISIDASSRASPEAAAAGAAAAVLADRHPKHEDRIQGALKSAIGENEASADGGRIGAAVAVRLLDARRNDGWSARQPYAPPARAGSWQPVPPSFAAATAPKLDQLRPFVMKSAGQYRISKVPSLASTEYVEEFVFVRDIGARESKVRTPDQEAIARFWLDGPGTFTPAGHWNAVYVVLARERGLKWRENLRNLALLNLALAEGTVIDSDEKYTFNRW